MIKNRHCVYTHTSPSGKVYVGQTVNIKKRWGYNGEHYKTKKKDGTFIQRTFARAIIKYGWENFIHEIILENISKEEADYAEKYLIKWYKLHNQSYNITDGGEGVCCPRPPLSEEARKKISERLLLNHPMRGKHWSPETLARITAANRNRVYTPEQKAKMVENGKRLGQTPITEERRRKYRDYRKAHPETWVGGWNKKEVHQYGIDGKYIKSYSSAEEAGRSLGRKSGTDILSCINGKCASAYGYLWKTEKVESIDVSQYKIIPTAHGARFISMTEEDKLRRSGAHGKAVNQYSLNGEYIATYNSVTDAKQSINYKGGGINKCCLHQIRYKTAGGYRWEYDTGDNRKKLV